MNRPISVLALIATGFMNVSAAPPAVDLGALRQVTGSELVKLIVGSAMGYGNSTPKIGGFSVFRADYHYKFYGSEAWGAEGPYRVEEGQVCVDTSSPWCFKVFSDKNGRKYILTSVQVSSGYQPVRFHHLRPEERI